MADRLEHPLHLMLAALVEDELDPRAVPRRRARAGAVRPSSSSTPSRERAHRLVGRLALDLGHIDLVDLVAGMGELVGELAVVREQEHAGRVGVEPADGDDPRGMLRRARRRSAVRRGSRAVVTTPAGLWRST